MTFFVNLFNLSLFSFLLSPLSYTKSRNSLSCGFIVDEGVAYSAAGASVVARFIVTLS